MENLIESNERTLVMFDAVCSGLANCLALVHSDIKQMTQHRNELVKLEHQQVQQARLVSPRGPAESPPESDKTAFGELTGGMPNRLHQDKKQDAATEKLANNLKLLDKRLADSFSQALNLNTSQQTHSWTLKQHTKPSLFQVLLGKSKSSNANNNNNKPPDTETKKLDKKTIIDDINRQTRMAMQYSKQLETHLFKVENLRSKYEMHLKMGLVVKSVARAYLAPQQTHGPVRQPQAAKCGLDKRAHHCSSLVINDSSSLSGTHSSVSSLNLSTWSSSRLKSCSDKSRKSAADTPEPKCRHHSPSTSTLSLSNERKMGGASSYGLSKLISPSAAKLVEPIQEACKHHQCGLAMGPDHVTHMLPRCCSHNACNSHRTHINNNNNSYDASNYEWPLAESTPYLNLKEARNRPTRHKSTINLTETSALSTASLRKNKKDQQVAHRTTIKEFIENIAKIEEEFEAYMGSFLVAIEDIQGFARVCQGDVFEVSIKYGGVQKLKSKISVLKENRQKCDNRQAVFKARITDVLAIKAYECKGLGKRVLLGHKLCETRDLFTARTQLMTISLNQTGSIKLNLIVTWNPLHMTPSSTASSLDTDIAHVCYPPLSSTTMLSSSHLSVPSIYSATSIVNQPETVTTINIQSQKAHKMGAFQQQQQQQQKNLHDPLYQMVDSTYGYYVPPPDYLTNELKYGDT